MPIRSIAQLKRWFQHGAYPSGWQFADWIDSFWHKEDQISINQVDNLADQLNIKYAKDQGEQLEKEVNQLTEQLQELREQLETNYVKKTDRVIVNGGEPTDLTKTM